jgi:O-6-methylguanine DNA methyltransferase
VKLARILIPTPLGEMLALATDDGLCALEFTGPRKRLTRLDARLGRWFPPHTIADRETPVFAATRAWLGAYFAGTNADVSSIPLDMRGGEFERRVWAELLTIAPGETRTYGAVARALGDPAASRAVGAANGANPVALVVPCHRVIGSSGSLTGYGGGLDRKQWLLDHERRWRPGALF